MIVYHGSNSNFKKLKISETLVRWGSTRTNEGTGIYFSQDIDCARSYGRYLYTLDINNNKLHDFTKWNTCFGYYLKIKKGILERTGVNIGMYLPSQVVLNAVEYLMNGGIAVSGFGGELNLLLDSNEAYYRLSESKRSAVEAYLRRCDRKPPEAYLFSYHIPFVGVIKDVSEDVVRIVGKELSR